MLREVKAARDEDAAQAALAALVEVARDARREPDAGHDRRRKAKATMGEIVDSLEGVFGRYVETPVF